MSNLKKVTALSLAAISILGTVASATFTDADDIKATDAVETLSALGIIAGNPDGSFNPEGTVTRAEMAKMIYTIKNGGNSNADAFKGSPTAFTDVNGHWAEGYIKYCSNQGIVSGKSATQFDPNAKVTGTEAFKMALTTLGYKADKSNLTGSKWDVNALALATETGLTDDYNMNVAEGAERQYAAQILYNALSTDVVYYSSIHEDYVNDQLGGNNNETLGEKYLDLQTGYAYFEDAQEFDSVHDKSDLTGGTTSDIELTNDMTKYIGEKVEVLYDDKKDVVYGITPVGNTIEVADTQYDVEIVNTHSLKEGDVTADLTDSNTAVFIDGVKKDHDDVNTIAKFNSAVNKFDDYSTKLVEYKDNDVKHYSVVITGVQVKEVTAVNDERILAGGTYKFEDENIDSNIEKGDVISVIENGFTEKADIVALDAEEGHVDRTREHDNKIEIDDVWLYTDNTSGVEAGDTVEYYVINGFAHNIEIVEGSISDDFLLVTAHDDGSALDADRAKVLFADGTSKTINIDEVVAIDNDGEEIKVAIADMTAYTYTSKDGDYKLTLANANMDDDMIMNPTGVQIVFNKDEGTLGTYPIDDEAIIIVEYKDATRAIDDKQAVITGAELKDWPSTSIISSANFYQTRAISGIDYIQVAHIELNTDIPVSVEDTFYGMLVDYATVKRNEDGERISELEIFNGVEVVTLEANYSHRDLDKGDYIKYDLSSDGKSAESVSKPTLREGAVIGFNGSDKVKFVNDPINYTIDEDKTKVIFIDSDDSEGVESGDISTADFYYNSDDTKVYTANVKYIIGSNNTLDVIFVDVNGKIKDSSEIVKI